MTPLSAVILAAGQGTRMKSERAKVLHEIGGAPLVSYPVKLALELGAAPTVLVIGHQGDAVRAALERELPGKLRFALQAEQRGTGHAVLQALPALEGFEGRVLILYGDVPLLRRETIDRLIEVMTKESRALVAVTMWLEDPSGYGRIIRDALGRVAKVVEHKDASPEEREIREGNAGIYLIDSRFLRGALGSLKNENAQGEYYLTDLVELAAQHPQGAGTVLLHDPREVLGVNDRAQLAELDAILRERINQRWMREGVTIVDPATTFIGPEVIIGRDTIIRPGAHLRGRTRIGRDCVIDVGAVLVDAQVSDEVEIRPYTVIEEAEVHPRAILGPFSRLRPGSEVMEQAHVGNFVELKKTRLGRGAKANHLAYLGDAKIGENANVGAGTITCNYDGFGKYVTEIGDRVFVGSNATLVAPLKIGEDSYVAAGSTLTEDVGPNSLVFGRARQLEKPGRAAAIREDAAKKARSAKEKKG